MVQTSGDWAFADVAEKDGKGNWSTATSVVARRQSGRWSIVMVGDPMENRGITAQIPADVRNAHGKWDAGHYCRVKHESYWAWEGLPAPICR